MVWVYNIKAHKPYILIVLDSTNKTNWFFIKFSIKKPIFINHSICTVIIYSDVPLLFLSPLEYEGILIFLGLAYLKGHREAQFQYIIHLLYLI